MHLTGGKMISSQQFSGNPFLAEANVTNTANDSASAAASTSKTWNGLSIGAANPARRIVICVAGTKNNSGVGPFTGATCDTIDMDEVSNTSVQGSPAVTTTCIYEIPQSSLPDPTVTTADFIVSSTTNSIQDWSISVFRVLSYTAGQGQSVGGNGGVHVLTNAPTITNLKAGHSICGCYVWQGDQFDGLIYPGEYLWQGEMTTTNHVLYQGVGSYHYFLSAMKNDSSSNASFAQQNNLTTSTVSYGDCASTAVWENI